MIPVGKLPEVYALTLSVNVLTAESIAKTSFARTTSRGRRVAAQAEDARSRIEVICEESIAKNMNGNGQSPIG